MAIEEIVLSDVLYIGSSRLLLPIGIKGVRFFSGDLVLLSIELEEESSVGAGNGRGNFGLSLFLSKNRNLASF